MRYLCFLLLWTPAVADQPAGETGSVSIAEFGADASGRIDSTRAIEQAILAARRLGRPVFVPPGVFLHRSFTLDGIGMYGTGPGSILLARSPTDSSIYLRGTGPSVRALAVRVASSRRDTRNFALNVDGARRFVIENTRVQGGNAGGILDDGGSQGRIIGNDVSDTLADAIHNTNGANAILIAGNTVRRAGDDMIAVVSYQGQPISHDILITGNDLADQQFGRGISVVGGRDVTIQGNTIAHTACCAGIYIASESAFRTLSVTNVLIRDNMLSDNSGRTHHGAIMLFADEGSVQQVRVEHNTIADARHAAIRLRGTVHDIDLIGNRFAQPQDGGIGGSGWGVFCRDNLLDGEPISSDTCNSDRPVSVTGSGLSP